MKENRLLRFIKNPRGQGMTEFALALPVFLLLLFGIMEVGRLLFMYSAIFTASREAARMGSAVGMGPNGTQYFRDCAGMRASAQRIGSIAGLEDGNITITYDKIDGTPHGFNCPIPGPLDQASADMIRIGDRVIVTVSGTFEPLVGLVELPTIPITSTSRRTIVRELQMPGSGAQMPTPLPTLEETPNRTATHYFGVTATAAYNQTATAIMAHHQTQRAAETQTAQYFATQTQAYWETATAFFATVTAQASITPTDGPSPTPTASMTPSPTASPTSSSTPTPDPTITPTPTNTPLPCPNGGSFTAAGNVKYFSVLISNFASGADDLVITNISASWQDDTLQQLNSVELDKPTNHTIWSNVILAPVANMPNAFYGWPSTAAQRTVYANTDATLTFNFDKNLTVSDLTRYFVEVTFSNTCKVNWTAR